MGNGHTIQLWEHRDRAHRLVDQAPAGSMLVIEPPRRTLDQNAKLWAMLTDVSMAMPEGRRHTPEDWKSIFMNACGWEVQFVEGLDGRPFPRGFRSSRMTKAQMIDLIEFIQAYGDQHGVRWSDGEAQAA
ncbi:recombination protein NinB [Croceicoccus sp. YJ47]|uniref:recombination protein NinB n=1 Tax=Croceicoccus sp. YJ47 TaxID=2798724 RepID=UPI0019207789|nr:recombination protein NinB [Croceicoccus sp. YJ47]QQN73910.1 recombination protein NinB [Croceicoccus sp. YJ47]